MAHMNLQCNRERLYLPQNEVGCQQDGAAGSPGASTRRHHVISARCDAIKQRFDDAAGNATAAC